MDFNKNIKIFFQPIEFIDSPSSGVRRLPLEREFKESGHTTSIVEYKPGATFSEHTHPLGEEIYVLEGTFSDENGDYPAGTYIRNAPGTSHSPFSKEGCLLYVKLNQFSPNDKNSFCTKVEFSNFVAGHGNLRVLPLAQYGTENTALVFWPKGERFIPHRHYGGEEILVISGVFKDEHGEYPKYTWLRSKHLSEHHPYVDEDTLILVKTGHLIKDL